ncbi:unnamed protein product [Rotaria sp. Silwood1]|nr:unnamed protein product [Rotaria sp. Silwood1]CAF1001255.1 unnamed protein product [Rotaria sp. Silwood1]CAF1010187.1 unnamed protein product [Rotaria sp. Silwood1]CAF3396420.1 unnamed protein product [Rotaria sp. Silwood1]CAF3410919.1 unnamed protein product [Rotaria sp. Silwood1]
MSSAKYILSDKNETISWTYDRLLSNASIEKKDLSLLGFIVGILCIISILCSLILRIFIYLYGRISLSKKSVVESPSITSSTTTNNTMSEF